MIRGLIIGKFLPVHKGHLGLISYAARQCDELIVSMSDNANDPIDPKLRLGWLKKLTAFWPNVRVASIKDDFDRVDLPMEQRTRIWADVINKTYGRIDKVFSSEAYGESFARHLGAVNVEFDRERSIYPVSATVIRQEPFRYWEYIPEEVRPYYLKRVCFYGPESTGKSSAAARLAKRYDTCFVPEVAREMITSNKFTVDDIIAIGQAQTARVLEYSKIANRVLICDTDLIVTQIYSQHYLGMVPEILYQLEKQVVYDKYFFFDIDVPWIADGLRDLEKEREDMREIFLNELTKRGIEPVMVRGSFEQRDQIVIKVIDDLLRPSR